MLDVAIWSEIYTLFEPLPENIGTDTVSPLSKQGLACVEIR